MTRQSEFDPSGVRAEAREAPSDADGADDPFRSSDPADIVHDVGLDVFESAWEDGGAHCPQCRRGTAAERGTSQFDHRRWVRFSCGDVVSQEQTAG